LTAASRKYARARCGMEGVGLRRRRGRSSRIQTAQAATLALGMDIVRQLTPIQLVLLAALTGFVAGRKI